MTWQGLDTVQGCIIGPNSLHYLLHNHTLALYSWCTNGTSLPLAFGSVMLPALANGYMLADIPQTEA